MPIFANPQAAPAPAYRASLASGDPGTAQTIAIMRQLVDQDLATASFVRFARDLVSHVPEHDELAEVEAIYDWVRTNIRFVKDPYTKETLSAPSDLLKIKSGDCDDISMLVGALALAIGYPARLVTVAAQPQSPDEFTHVYTEIEVPPASGNWVAADAARPGARFAEHPPMYFRKRAWSLADDSYQDLQGLSRLRGLGYIRYRTLGQDDSSGGGFDWSSIITPIIQETPSIIGVATGQPTTYKTGATTVTTGSPYGSYMTPYSPGYGIPQAGYPGVSLTATSNWIWPLLLIGSAILLMRGK